MTRKPLIWLNGEVKSPPFLEDSRIKAGTNLRLLQEGCSLALPISRHLPDIGRNCYELRIREAQHFWRIVYHLDTDAVVILEVYGKDTNKMPRHVLDVCKARLKRYHEDKNR
jgi:phage-related protein